MAATTTLHRKDWRTVLDEMNEEHKGKLVTIEVLDSSIGHQYEAERLPFSSIGYDPKDDTVIISVGGNSPRYPVVLRHMVPHPREIEVTSSDAAEPAVRLVDRDGSVTLVTFYPVHYPAPAGKGS